MHHLLILVCLLITGSVCAQQDSGREQLLKLLAGEWNSRALYAAAKLGIADQLELGPKSIEELSEATSSHPESLYRILRLLSGYAIFEEVAPRVFANTENSRLLAKSSPDSLNSLAVFYGEDLHQAWDEIVSCVQTGLPAFQIAFKQPVFAYFKDHPDRSWLFQTAMKEKSTAVIKSALASYDFGHYVSICDVGCGYGQFMSALLKQYPQTSGVVFDLPEVANKLSHLASKQCKVVSGDFFESIPVGCEAYVLKSVLHDWSDDDCEKILKNCHKAMIAEGKLLVIEVVLLPKDQSLYANSMDVLMMAITGGKERTASSFEQLLKQSGFELENIYSTGTEFSILEARKR